MPGATFLGVVLARGVPIEWFNESIGISAMVGAVTFGLVDVFESTFPSSVLQKLNVLDGGAHLVGRASNGVRSEPARCVTDSTSSELISTACIILACSILRPTKT